MGTRSLLVPCDPASAAEVRHRISDDLVQHGVAESCVDDVVLVTSELVGNAIVHAGCGTAEGLDVRWDIQPDCVTVHVHDASDEAPQPQQPGHDVTRGRGLAIVAALASEWGVQASAPGGKQVWARVPLARSSDRQTA